jgi:hypothetical protein
VDYIYVSLDIDQWRALVDIVINLRETVMCCEFLEWVNKCWFLKKDSVPWNPFVSLLF